MSLANRRILHNLKIRRRAHIGAYLGFKPSQKAQGGEYSDNDICLLIKASKVSTWSLKTIEERNKESEGKSV